MSHVFYGSLCTICKSWATLHKIECQSVCIAINKLSTHPRYIIVLGSSKGEVSRHECIEKIAASINYVHSQTTNVITGMSQTRQYAFFSNWYYWHKNNNKWGIMWLTSVI